MPVASVGVDAAPLTAGILATSHGAQGQAGAVSPFGRWFTQQLAASQGERQDGPTSAVPATAAGSALQTTANRDSKLSSDSSITHETQMLAPKTSSPANDEEQDAKVSAVSVPTRDAVPVSNRDDAPRPSAATAGTDGLASSSSRSSVTSSPAVARTHVGRAPSRPSSAPAAASPSNSSTASAPRSHTASKAPQTDHANCASSTLSDLSTSTAAPYEAVPAPHSIGANSAASVPPSIATSLPQLPAVPEHGTVLSSLPAQPAVSTMATLSNVEARNPAAVNGAAEPVRPSATHLGTPLAGEAASHTSEHGVAASASPSAPPGTAVTAVHPLSIATSIPSTAVASGGTPALTSAFPVTAAHAVVSTADTHSSTTTASAEHAQNAFERIDTSAAPQVLAGTPQRLSIGVRDPALGWVEIHTRTAAGEISVALATPSAASHTAISAQLPAIRDYLSGQQVRVDHLTAEQFSASSGGRDNSAGNQPQAKDTHATSAGATHSPLTEQSSESEGQNLSWIDVRV